MTKWYELANPTEVDTPALMIHPERVKQNIHRAKEIVQDVNRLRPHVKTHKMLEVAKIQVAAGINKFKCATIAEAEMMAQAGAQDILIAYQLVGPRPTHLMQLKNRYTESRFSSIVDSHYGIQCLTDADLMSNGISVFIDVNLGHHRTGIAPGSELDRLIRTIQDHPNVELRGFHAYDGHIGDISLEARTKRSNLAFSTLRPYLDLYPSLSLVAGGIPTFAVHSQYENRESSPGTFVFWDHGYQSKFPEYGFQYAAVLATRIISKLDHQTFCFDLGHKHVAAEGDSPQIAFLDCPSYEQLIHSEEHLTIRFDETMTLDVGDILYGVPRHICPTVALYPSAQIIVDNKVQDEWAVTSRNINL